MTKTEEMSAFRRTGWLLSLLGALFWVLARDVGLQMAPEGVQSVTEPGPAQGAEDGVDCVVCGESALEASALRLKVLRGGFVDREGGMLLQPRPALAGGGLKLKHEIGNMLFLFASLWGIDAARNGAPAAGRRWRVGNGASGVGSSQTGQLGRPAGWVNARLVQGRCGNGALREVLRATAGGGALSGGLEAGFSKAGACFASEAGFARFDCSLVTGAGYSCANSGRDSSSSSSICSSTKPCPVLVVSGYLQSWRYVVLSRHSFKFSSLFSNDSA